MEKGTPKLDLRNCDCMDLMSEFPDKHFDLAIVDPPYGIGKTWNKKKKGTRGDFNENTYKNKKPPEGSYFKELFRVSKEWIIWGSNYYSHWLTESNNLICWDKECTYAKEFRSEFELAQTSIKRYPALIFRIPWSGGRKGNETGIKTIHPHQKPISLYSKQLELYGTPGGKILDTHLGSGSIAIACHYMGFDLTGCELDKDYYAAAMKRIKEETKQISMFMGKASINICYG